MLSLPLVGCGRVPGETAVWQDSAQATPEFTNRPSRAEPAAVSRLEIAVPAYLSLRATTYPAGGPYDRAYWRIIARCDPAAQRRTDEPLWEYTLHPYWDAGPVPEGSEWGSPPPGDYTADVHVGGDWIHLYLHWSDESISLSKGSRGKPGRSRGRSAFDAAARAGGEATRLAVDFAPPRKASSSADFTRGAGLITGVPGNLGRPATTRAFDEE